MCWVAGGTQSELKIGRHKLGGGGGIAGKQPNECNVISNIYLWKLVTDVY